MGLRIPLRTSRKRSVVMGETNDMYSMVGV